MKKGIQLQASFKEAVQSVVRGIPKGKTLSYKEVAIRAGRPEAARAVGTLMSQNTDTTIPCHRVIRSDGKVGGYNGLRGGTTGNVAKASLLRAEGALA